MSDEREHDRLNHLAEMIPAPEDGMGKLHDRRDRQRRNRRLTSGVVGVALTAALTVGAYQLWAPNAVTGPADGTTPVETAADVGRIECNTDGANVLTSHVAAQADGVHLVLVNNGTPAMYLIEWAGGGGLGDRAELPETQINSPDFPPGTITIKCYDESVDPTTGGVAAASFEIVDPSGHWVSTTLACPSPETAILDYMPGLTGEEGEPEDVARNHIGSQLQDGDIVERAGYAEAATNAVVRVVRDGRSLAAVYMFSVIEGGWMVNTISTCQEFNA